MAMALNYQQHTPQYEDFSIIKVPVDRLPSMWKHIEPHLSVGMSVAPELKPDDVIDGLSDESVQLWIVTCDNRDGRHEIVAAFLTSIERDREDWVVSLYALGGSQVKLWLHHCDDAMAAFARREGAKRIRMYGRKAWQRLLPETFAITGQRQGHNVYERAIG